MDAAVAAVEQRTVPGFEGIGPELETFLVAGIDAPALPEGEFWNSIDYETDAMLVERQSRVPSVKVYYRQDAKDDLIRQFRTIRPAMSVPEIAVRFHNAFKRNDRVALRTSPHSTVLSAS